MTEPASAPASSIRVAVRIRPFTASEQTMLVAPQSAPVFLGDGSLSEPSAGRPRAGAKIRKVVSAVDDRMLVFDPPDSTNPMLRMQRSAFPGVSPRLREHRFVFDQVFGEEASQHDVYAACCRPLLASLLDGFNATVFAYGATGCGKTHTISGTPAAPGIIFLTMRDLFARIDSLRDTKVVELSLSYLEIYNESIRDLLNPANTRPMALREDSCKRISVTNLSTRTPRTVDEVMDMILQGNANRTMSPTEANATSSRSHAVLQINVAQKNRTAALAEDHTFGTLSIIDLAGSERASATKNKGERLIEGANINKSLLALGNCINALCDRRPGIHVPYRDSKLTRLLKFSLGGNCLTAMIVCVSPSSAHYDETLNTLKYADRAKKIKTKAVRNLHTLDRHVGSYLKMITDQKAEIEQLRAREASAVDAALQKYKSDRAACTAAVHEADRQLGACFDSADRQWRQQQLKCRSRMQLVAGQLQVIGMWYDAQSDTHVPPKLLERVNQQLETLRSRLMSEYAALEKLGDSRAASPLLSNIALLARRLRETADIQPEDLERFDKTAELYKTQGELEISRVQELPAPLVLRHALTILFSVLSDVHGVCAYDGTIEAAALLQSFQKIQSAVLEKLSLLSSEFGKNAPVQSTSTEILSDTPAACPLPSPAGTVASTAKKRVGSGISLAPPAATRRSTSFGKNAAAVLSNTSPRKKSIKRVRWDGENARASGAENISPVSSPPSMD